MINKEDLDKMLNTLKEIKKEEAKTDKSIEKLGKGDLNRRQERNLMNNQAYTRHHINRLEHELHCLMVENNLAKPFGEDYYGDRLFYPDAWHTSGFKYNLRKPKNFN